MKKQLKEVKPHVTLLKLIVIMLALTIHMAFLVAFYIGVQGLFQCADGTRDGIFQALCTIIVVLTSANVIATVVYIAGLGLRLFEKQIRGSAHTTEHCGRKQ